MNSLVLVSSIGTAVGLGSNVREAALVDQWVHFAEFEIGMPTQNIAGIVYGYSKPFSVEVSRFIIASCAIACLTRLW